MSDVQTLPAKCHELGATFFPQPNGKLKVWAPAPLPEELRAELKQHKAEIMVLLKTQAQARSFLPRPLGQEKNPDPWDAWAPFFDWLREHHPDHFFAVCEAEEAIRALERQGITKGRDYEAAYQELARRFEAARQLKLKESVKVWLQ